MINLRYHIVSLTAVFLALGLGILAGTTVIDQEVVDQLRRNTRSLERQIDGLREEVAGLKDQQSIWGRFGERVVPPLLAGRLAGRPIVLLVDKDVPGDLVGLAARALTDAYAKEPTQLTFTGKWVLDQPSSVEQLATALGAPGTNASAVLGVAANRIAGRLAQPSDVGSPADLIRTLRDAGFLGVSNLPSTGAFPAANALVVLLSSGSKTAAPPEDAFSVPLIRSLSASRLCAVAEPLGAQDSLAEKIRRDQTLSRAVSTVDHVDTVAGRYSLVYGLRDLISGRVASHYGVRNGSDGVAPKAGA